MDQNLSFEIIFVCFKKTSTNVFVTFAAISEQLLKVDFFKFNHSSICIKYSFSLVINGGNLITPI
jgi:hypothetical protein